MRDAKHGKREISIRTTRSVCVAAVCTQHKLLLSIVLALKFLVLSSKQSMNQPCWIAPFQPSSTCVRDAIRNPDWYDGSWMPLWEWVIDSRLSLDGFMQTGPAPRLLPDSSQPVRFGLHLIVAVPREPRTELAFGCIWKLSTPNILSSDESLA